MKGASACHMCGRCSGHRDAIALSWRSPSQEVVELGRDAANAWDTALILYGLLGIAIGAFHWTVSPWFVELKQFLAAWLIDHDVTWPLATNAPWFLLTHYPEQNDVFSWLDGALVIGYIVGTGLVYGTALLGLMALATRVLGAFDTRRLHHLTQALIPVAGVGVFLGLSATTLSLLRAEHIPLGWASDVRIGLLAAANLWSIWLGWRITSRYQSTNERQADGRGKQEMQARHQAQQAGQDRFWVRRVLAMAPFVAALAMADSAWWLMFWGFAR